MRRCDLIEDAFNLTPGWTVKGGVTYERINLHRTVTDLNTRLCIGRIRLGNRGSGGARAQPEPCLLWRVFGVCGHADLHRGAPKYGAELALAPLSIVLLRAGNTRLAGKLSTRSWRSAFAA